MRAKLLTVAAATLLAGLTGCSGDDTATPPPTDTTTSTSTSTSASTGADGQCPVGRYEVTTISGKAGADVNGVPITATSGGGLTLALTADTWTLSGEGAEVTLQSGGVSVDATIDGTAEGGYATSGADTYLFRQERASGRVTLSKPIAGVSSIPMADVGPAFTPTGSATLTCDGDNLTISSESVELELERTGGSSGGPGGPSGSSGPSTPAGQSGGGLTITDSAVTRTLDCGSGGDVTVNGSSNTLTFTGECAKVSVNGSKNEVKLARAAEIEVTGSLNTVTWAAGDPRTSNTGTGNRISQG